MVNPHMFLTGVVALIGVAAYQTDGFRNFTTQKLFEGSNSTGSNFTQSVVPNSLPSSRSIDRFLDSSTNAAQGYGSSLTNGMKSGVTDMTNYIEDQCEQLARTVQGAYGTRGRPQRAIKSRKSR
jgi:hypothetical protein